MEYFNQSVFTDLQLTFEVDCMGHKFISGLEQF